MDKFVDDRTPGLALEFLAEPLAVHVDARTAGGRRNAAHVVAEAERDVRRGAETIARQHGDDLGIPLLHDGLEFRLGPFGEVRSGRGVDGELVLSVRRFERLQDRLGVHDGIVGRCRPVGGDHVDLAVEGVAEGVAGFGEGDVEEQVAELADRTVGVSDRNRVLAAAIAFFRTRVDAGDEFPATRHRVGALLRPGLEAVTGTVRRIEPVNLRTSGAAVPGVGVDLLHRDHLAEIDLDTAAVRAGAEEKVGCRFVFAVGNAAVVKHVEGAAIGITGAVHESERGRCGRVVVGGRGHRLEAESRAAVALHRCDLDGGLR